MNLHDYATSYKLSKKLKELGVNQKSFLGYIYLGNNEMALSKFKNQSEESKCATFMVSELLDMLPAKIINDFGLHIIKLENNRYKVGYTDLDNNTKVSLESADTLANTCAEILIHLIEHKLISIKLYGKELPEPPEEKEKEHCEVSGAELPPKKIYFEWEGLDRFTARAKVIGGWVLSSGGSNNVNSYSESIVFIPDPNHEWEIE